MSRFLFLITLLSMLSACSTSPELSPGYRLDAQASEGLAVVSLTMSGKDIEQISSLTYRVREAVADDEMEEATRRPYFQSPRQHIDWIQDKHAQDSTERFQRLVVKDYASAEPLDVVGAGRTLGRLATLRLPAGEYELYDWKLVLPNEYGGIEYGAKRNIGYRFKVQAGRATYLGNVDLRLTEQDTYKVSVESKPERDLALLAKKVPSIRADEITIMNAGLR